MNRHQHKYYCISITARPELWINTKPLQTGSHCQGISPIKVSAAYCDMWKSMRVDQHDRCLGVCLLSCLLVLSHHQPCCHDLWSDVRCQVSSSVSIIDNCGHAVHDSCKWRQSSLQSADIECASLCLVVSNAQGHGGEKLTSNERQRPFQSFYTGNLYLGFTRSMQNNAGLWSIIMITWCAVQKLSVKVSKSLP